MARSLCNLPHPLHMPKQGGSFPGAAPVNPHEQSLLTRKLVHLARCHRKPTFSNKQHCSLGFDFCIYILWDVCERWVLGQQLSIAGLIHHHSSRISPILSVSSPCWAGVVAAIFNAPCYRCICSSRFISASLRLRRREHRTFALRCNPSNLWLGFAANGTKRHCNGVFVVVNNLVIELSSSSRRLQHCSQNDRLYFRSSWHGGEVKMLWFCWTKYFGIPALALSRQSGSTLQQPCA